MAKLCALCGKAKATTKDHIPPKGIYPKPYDPKINFKTVPACAGCNNGASADDEWFKVLIGVATGAYREDTQAVIDSVARTIGNNQSVANQLFRTHRDVYAQLRGELLEPAVAVTFDNKRYSAVISRIVQGLHWIEYGTALGDEIDVRVMPAGMDRKLFLSMKDVMDCLPPKYLNNETFAYKFYKLDEGDILWGMQFFKRHTVFAYVDALET